MKRVTEIECVEIGYAYDYGIVDARVNEESYTLFGYGECGGNRKPPRTRGGQVRNFWYRGKCVRSPAVCDLLGQYGDLEFGDAHETEPLRWALAVYHTAGRMHFKQVHKGA